jgi:hypothetical protein
VAISERQLEENEVTLDNLLHKILEAAKEIRGLRSGLGPHTSAEMSKRLLDDIDMLAQTICELTSHADIIDEQDEELTRGLEREIKNSLDEAIFRIMNARRTLQ